MQIRITRSGGFAAMPGMVVEATVRVPENGPAEVEADSGHYHRTLSPEETEGMRRMAEAACHASSGSDVRGGASTADQYQYDLTIDSGGNTCTVTFGDQPGPALKGLKDWVREETQRVWQERIKRRRAPA